MPYNISTEIIFKVLDIASKIKDIHFMMQKEVVDRMIAKPGSKEYGRLSVMAQIYFSIKKLFDISPNVFFPKPKVMSSYIRLIPNSFPFDNKKHEERFKVQGLNDFLVFSTQAIGALAAGYMLYITNWELINILCLPLLLFLLKSVIKLV